MDYHPIPQNVTGFQFKLIGSMTLKQFAYVASGVILATIVYFLPVNVIIKVFLIPLFGISGIIVAFLPVEGRSIDVMLVNFIKALLAPNQYVYKKSSASSTSLAHGKPSDLGSLIPQLPPKEPKNELDKKASESFNQSQSQAMQSVLPVEASTKQAETVISQQAGSLEEQIKLVHSQKQQLEQQLQDLKAQLTYSKQPYYQTTQQHVHSLPIDMARKAGLAHVSDTPNVIVGIVKDARGNVLSGMLIEIKDKDGNPVRAFKTNQLGQFASATPLAYGTYTLELEDPKKQHSFDKIQVLANNQVMLPIEIISHDEREELRKELFA